MTNDADIDLPDLVGVPSDRRLVEVGGLAMRYLVWGDPARPPVVLVHGGKDHARNWDWTVAALVRDWCCIVPDLRGHGDSDHASGGGYSEELFVSDFSIFIDHLAREGFDGPLPMIGHSMGGNIILRQAALFPETVSRLVVIEGLGSSVKMHAEHMAKPLAERLGPWVRRRAASLGRTPRRFSDPEEMVAKMAEAHPHLRADQARHLALHGARKYEDGWGWKHDRQLGFYPPVALTDPAVYGALYARIKVPVLLLYGGRSWASHPADDGRIDAFHDARLITYEQAGHWLHHEEFNRYIADVTRFLGEGT